MQQQQAIQIKKEINMRMIEERKLMQESIKQIDMLEKKGVDEALAKR